MREEEKRRTMNETSHARRPGPPYRVQWRAVLRHRAKGNEKGVRRVSESPGARRRRRGRHLTYEAGRAFSTGSIFDCSKKYFSTLKTTGGGRRREKEGKRRNVRKIKRDLSKKKVNRGTATRCRGNSSRPPGEPRYHRQSGKSRCEMGHNPPAEWTCIHMGSATPNVGQGAKGEHFRAGGYF